MTGMDFRLDERQDAARKAAAAVFAARPAPSGDGLDRDDWMSLARADLVGLGLEPRSGGAGCGVLEVCAALIEQGRSTVDAPFAETALVAAPAIERFGGGAHTDLLHAVVGGRLIVVPVLGGDLPTATDRDGGWVLDGVADAVGYAPVADLLVVPARRTGGDVAVFLVDATGPGVTVTGHGRTTGRVGLADAVIGADRLLGGSEVHRFLIDRAVIGVCADQVGVLEEALHLTARYCGERTQFDRRIGEFQAVAMRAADAHADVVTCAVTMWRAAWLLATGQPADAALAVAKFWAAEAGYRVSTAAQHLHGGIGVVTDYPLHRYLRRARHNELALGGASEQLAGLGQRLAQEGPDS